MKTVLTLLVLAILQSSCHQKLTNKKEITEFISDTSNGLTISHELDNDVKVSMVYVPQPLLKVPKLNSKKNAQCYFSFRISRKHNQLLRQLSLDHYSKMVSVLSFRMQDYVAAIDSKNSEVRPTQSVYQQTFGLTNYDELMIVFDAKNILSSKNFKITVDEFGLGLGSLDFNFRSDDIITINKIATEII